MIRRQIFRCRGLLAALTVLTCLAVAAPAQAALQIDEYSGGIFGEGGEASVQAGAHPFDAVNTIVFHTAPKEVPPGVTEEVPTASPKNVITAQPLGLVGSPASLRRCPNSQFVLLNLNTGAESSCPDTTAIGLAEVEFPYGLVSYSPIYNLQPPPGQVAQFGFMVSLQSVRLNASVGYRPGEGYGVVINSLNVSQGLTYRSFRIHLWGVPGVAAHNEERGSCVSSWAGPGGNCPSGEEGSPAPFLRNPTSCTGPLRTGLEATSWQEPDAVVPGGFESPALDGCSRLPFSPTITVEPTSTAADNPTGLKVDIHMPQAGLENPVGLSESDLRKAVVTLPEGMAVNPAAADGQAACGNAQIDLAHPTAPPSCPEASKIGTVQIHTPLLEKPLPGSIYLAKQGENEFGALLALYVVVDDPRTGIVLKLPGRVETSPSGRLTTEFAETPQLPFEDFELEFFSGARAPLVNPPSCGTYSTRVELSPWSGTAPVDSDVSFKVDSGPGGSACPGGGFEPRFTAGTANPVAGSYSAFTLRVSRDDGTQRLASVGATLPAGLLAKLSGIPYCPEAALAGISDAEGTGAAQLAAPSCPAASKVGTVSVGAGAGPDPFYLDTGTAYLAGPYKGAPLSLAIVTPAVAGPFDLGNVVVRTALRVDPETTVVSAASDPLPTVLHGIPLDLRDVWVNLDREGFTLNPTNCEASKIAAVGGATANPSSRFQIADCAALGLEPKLAMKFSGAPTRRGGHPKLTATLTTGKNEANLKQVQVTLPKTEYLENAHIKTVCTRVQYAANQCPQKSIYGYARAWTPLLDKPLEGPVYLRSSSHKLPDLVASLDGQIHIDLAGRISSVKARIRNTFEMVPDAPVSKFVLTMQGGGKGLLVNNTNLCKAKPRANVEFDGQNGKVHDTEPLVWVSGCGKGGKKGNKKK